jgi:hypothetical protein
VSTVESPARGRLLQVASPLLALAAAALTIRYIVVTWVNRIPTDARFPYDNLILTDFRDAVWLPSRYLLAGHDPYDDAAFLAAHPATQGYSPYTPSHLLLTIWAGLLEWPTATLVWAIVMGLACAAMGGWTGYAVLRVWRGGGPLGANLALLAVSVGVLAVWVWRPTSNALGMGQPSAVWGPAAAVATAATVTAVGLPGWVRTVLSALAIAKPQTGINLALAAGVARQWRNLAWGFVIAAGLSLVVAIGIAGTGVVGWILGLPAAVGGRHSRFDQAYTDGNPWMDVMSTAYRLGLPDAASLGLALLVLVLGITGAVLLRRAGRTAASALLAAVTGLLVVPHCGYDLLLLFPVLALAVVWLVRRDPRDTGWLLTVGAVVPLVLAGFLPTFRLPIVPGGLEPALGQASLTLVGFALLVAAAFARRAR